MGEDFWRSASFEGDGRCREKAGLLTFPTSRCPPGKCGDCLSPVETLVLSLWYWCWGLNMTMWAQEVAQQVEIAAKPDDPSSSPGIHMVEGENQLPQVVL